MRSHFRVIRYHFAPPLRKSEVRDTPTHTPGLAAPHICGPTMDCIPPPRMLRLLMELLNNVFGSFRRDSSFGSVRALELDMHIMFGGVALVDRPKGAVPTTRHI